MQINPKNPTYFSGGSVNRFMVYNFILMLLALLSMVLYGNIDNNVRVVFLCAASGIIGYFASRLSVLEELRYNGK